MPTKKETFIDKMKPLVYIILAMITLGGTIVAVNGYFAKSEEVSTLKNNDSLIEERLDIAITDDRIHMEEARLRRMEDWQKFEQKSVQPELSPMEKEVMDEALKKIEELEKEREMKLESYEQRRLK